MHRHWARTADCLFALVDKRKARRDPFPSMAAGCTMIRAQEFKMELPLKKTK
jgi:hypothetical protein